MIESSYSMDQWLKPLKITEVKQLAIVTSMPGIGSTADWMSIHIRAGPQQIKSKQADPSVN